MDIHHTVLSSGAPARGPTRPQGAPGGLGLLVGLWDNLKGLEGYLWVLWVSRLKVIKKPEGVFDKPGGPSYPRWVPRFDHCGAV